jgi:hypothetical protein
MEVTVKDINKFKQVVKCPKCRIEIIADHREDLG